MEEKYLYDKSNLSSIYARKKARNAEIAERRRQIRVDKMLYWFENERPKEEMTANVKINIE